MEALFIAPLLLLIPLASAGFAHSKGHSFWFWLAMGILIPVISHFIIFFLREKEVVHTGLFAPVPTAPQTDKVLYKRYSA